MAGTSKGAKRGWETRRAHFNAHGLKGVSIPTSGLRQSSFEYLRSGGTVRGGPPKIGVEPSGKPFIIDGRHRVLIARSRGEVELKDAEVFGYDSRGNVKWKHRGPVKI